MNFVTAVALILAATTVVVVAAAVDTTVADVGIFIASIDIDIANIITRTTLNHNSNGIDGVEIPNVRNGNGSAADLLSVI